MPSPTRKTSSVWVLTSRRGETETLLYATAMFKTAYALALFEHRIAEPNLAERKARQVANSAQDLWLWDRSRFESLEQAMWSPVGDAVRIKRVLVKKK